MIVDVIFLFDTAICKRSRGSSKFNRSSCAFKTSKQCVQIRSSVAKFRVLTSRAGSHNNDIALGSNTSRFHKQLSFQIFQTCLLFNEVCHMQSEAVINAGPAVFISASGPNPVMVQVEQFHSINLFSINFCMTKLGCCSLFLSIQDQVLVRVWELHMLDMVHKVNHLVLHWFQEISAYVSVPVY